MKTILSALVILANVYSYAAQTGTSGQCPTAHGAYYLVHNEWKAMEIANSMGLKVTGMYSHAMKATFNGKSSPYQIEGSEPKFCLVGITDSGRNLTLARFNVTGKERELQFAKIGIRSLKVEIEEKRIVPIEVVSVANKVYLVSSKAPLSEGEYILLPTTVTALDQDVSMSGYDLGVHSR